MNRRRARRFAAWLALAGLLVRAAIPAGYMPGSLFGGEPIVPCPSGFPAALFHEAGRHGAGHDQHDQDTSPDGVYTEDFCPLGTALHTAFLLHSLFTLAPTPAEPTARSWHVQGAVSPPTPRNHPARAPPTVS